MFTHNEAGWDRGARIVLGVALIVIGFLMGGTWGWVLGVIGLIPLLTGAIGWCPLYSVFKIDTCHI